MSKGRSPGYRPGNHWLICDRCGFAVRSSEARETWNGLVVCEADWEPRHPQDMVRGRNEDTSAKGLVRPEAPDSYVTEPSFVDTTGDPDYTVPDGTF